MLTYLKSYPKNIQRKVAHLLTGIADKTLDQNLPVQNFSPITFSSRLGVNPLPVELVNFNALLNNEVVYLNWITASEISNDYFTIERSNDALNWKKIITVKGAGNSAVQNTYNSKDLNPLKGVSYYRLVQTDFNGEKEYSDLQSVNMKQSNSFTIFPNPVLQGNFINVQLTNFSNTFCNVKLLNVEGVVLYADKVKVVDNNIFQISTNKLAAGLYMLYIQTGSSYLYQKVVIK